MAYPTNQRDPLIDSAMQEALEKRGRELLGLILLGAAAALSAALVSYVPDDASFFSATDAPAENWLGRFGASVAAPLFLVLGFGSWGLAVALAAWGLRLLANAGADRALGRGIFAPIAVAAASVYASTLVPSSGWTHSFGLGGLFGDTVLGALLNILPVQAASGLRLLALPIGLGTLALALYATGFTRAELARALRFVVYGVVAAYAGLRHLLGLGAARTREGARALAARRAARAEARHAAEPEMPRPDPSGEATDGVRRAAIAAPEPPVTRGAGEKAARGGLIASVSTLVRRAPEPELPPRPEPPALADEDAPTDDRIRARISDAIRARARTGRDVRPAPVGRPEPPVKRRRGPDPLLVKVPDAVPSAPMAELETEETPPEPEAPARASEAPRPAPAPP